MRWTYSANQKTSLLNIQDREGVTDSDESRLREDFEQRRQSDISMVKFYTDLLKASFETTGPLWAENEDGTISLNAFKVRHGDHGTLVRVDAGGAVHTPAGTPQDPWRLMNGMPPEGRVVNQVV